MNIIIRRRVPLAASVLGVLRRLARPGPTQWIAERSDQPPELVARIVSGPQVSWTMAPQGTLASARSMREASVARTAPTRWQELVLPRVHGLAGG